MWRRSWWLNKDQAQVFLKRESVAKYRSDSLDKRFRRLPESGRSARLSIGSVDSFREDLNAAESRSGASVPVEYDKPGRRLDPRCW